MTDLWQARREALGAFIRQQRQRAGLSLRQLAERTSLSNPYLSQVERGLHQPSVRVLKAISDALNLSAETLLAEAGLIDAMAGATSPDTRRPGPPPPGTEDTIQADPLQRRIARDVPGAAEGTSRRMADSADRAHGRHGARPAGYSSCRGADRCAWPGHLWVPSRGCIGSGENRVRGGTGT